MAEPDSIVPTHLRRIDDKVDRMAEDVRELKVGMTAVEENLALMHRRIDRVDARLDRIERRLDLVETPH